MSNTFYNYTDGQPVALSRGSSSAMRSEFTQIGAGFDAVQLAVNGKGAIAGQNWAGTHDYTAGTIKVPTLAVGSSGAFAASVDYVNQQAYSAALPGQTGNADKMVTTDGAATPTASFTDKLNVSVLKFVDGTDKTKQVQMIASGLTTATTRKIYVPDRDVTLGGFTNLLVISATQTWTPPAGITRAKITVIDGGYSSPTINSGTGNSTNGGKGGSASISVRTVSPSVTYTATVGAGGVGANAGTSTTGSAGGASSFAGNGFTTLTSGNGDLKVPGGLPTQINALQGGSGGTSLYALKPDPQTTSTAIGQGANGVVDGAAGNNGNAGAVIIEY